jgi:apolipoprotein D and lipocalin family protein
VTRALALSGIFFMALTAASATVGCGQDPPLAVAQSVDLGRFSGQWYEIAKLPRVTQTDCWATTAEYTMGADGTLQLVHRCNVGSLTGDQQTVTMTASAPDPNVPAKLALDVMGFTGDYWILEVGSDYEYAVVGHPSRSYLWILSRTPTLDDATLQGALGRARASGFDTTKLEYTPQPGGPATPQGNVPPSLGTGCSAGSGEPASAGIAAGALVAMAIAIAAARRKRAS